MSQLVYRLDDVVKAYGSRVVLDIRYLEVYRGEILGIVGPSGAGKSTLLRLLDFLEPPTRGRLRFGDYVLDGTGPPPLEIRRRVTTVFQRPVLLSGTVFDNVAYGLRIRGVKDVGQRVNAILEQVRLQDFARAPVRSLSGGEAQRVALARALVIEPEVLLLDEPTANLDPANVALIEEIVRRVNAQQGTTIVLVTHNVFQARRLAHRVVLLLNGQVVEVGPTQAFFEAPQDPRTAAFVRGDMIY
jgi:tungstate transport system ATP-binding protein